VARKEAKAEEAPPAAHSKSKYRSSHARKYAALPQGKSAPEVAAEKRTSAPAAPPPAEARKTEISLPVKSEKRNPAILIAIVLALVCIGAVSFYAFRDRSAKAMRQMESSMKGGAADRQQDLTAGGTAADGSNATNKQANAAGPNANSKLPDSNAEAKTGANGDSASAVNGKTMAANSQYIDAPSRISRDGLGGRDATPAPGDVGAANLSGENLNAAGGVFKTQGKSKVQLAPVVVSAGVSSGMLIHRTVPAYPTIAKVAHITGTVVIRAVISKNGTIVNADVISGPTVLRKAALDALKTWRYRPYLLNNEPVEAETTVNVNFVQN
jgi:TonB family protein